MIDMEQPCFWKQVQFQNRIWITILGSKTDFEFGPNLLGVQSHLERFDKFPKIIIFLDIPECEFRLAWLYGKIWSFHTSFIRLGLKINEKRVWIWIQTKPSSFSSDQQAFTRW
jgi:hypothetical protein